MATFVQLVDRLRLEGSLPVPAITTVQGAVSDDVRRAANWVADAWRDVQLMDRDWRWMRRQVVGPVTAAGGMRYTPTALGVPAGVGHRRWWAEGDGPGAYKVRAFSTANPSNEWVVRWLPRDDFAQRFLVGDHAAGPPAFWSEADNGDLLIGPKPDTTYSVRADYVKAVQELVADGDVPELPTELHLAIMWRGLYSYGVNDASPEVITRARVAYNALEAVMVRDHGARIETRFGTLGR